MPGPEHQKITLFSDPHDAQSAGDGYFRKYNLNYTWAQTRVGNADEGSSGGLTALAGIMASIYTNKWQNVSRFFCCFDTRFIPAACSILKASLIVWCDDFNFGSPFNGCFGVSTCYPDNPAVIVKADWTKVHTTQLVEVLYKEQIEKDTYLEFKFTPSGLAYIQKEGITKLCIREAAYEIMNNEPEWNANFDGIIDFRPADQANIEFRPRLVLEYRE